MLNFASLWTAASHTSHRFNRLFACTQQAVIIINSQNGQRRLGKREKKKKQNVTGAATAGKECCCCRCSLNSEELSLFSDLIRHCVYVQLLLLLLHATLTKDDDWLLKKGERQEEAETGQGKEMGKGKECSSEGDYCSCNRWHLRQCHFTATHTWKGNFPR